jgi:hypothetical protein
MLIRKLRIRRNALPQKVIFHAEGRIPQDPELRVHAAG